MGKIELSQGAPGLGKTGSGPWPVSEYGRVPFSAPKGDCGSRVVGGSIVGPRSEATRKLDQVSH